jgi:hypothetical protein
VSERRRAPNHLAFGTARPIAAAALFCLASLIATLVLLLALPKGPEHASAQELSIKVLVNDDPISDYDIEQRERFVEGAAQRKYPPKKIEKDTDPLFRGQ